MLQIYSVILSFVEDVAALLPKIAHHDPDLARQLRRSSASIALNTAEAWVARGRSRTACFNLALREMRESYTRSKCRWGLSENLCKLTKVGDLKGVAHGSS